MSDLEPHRRPGQTRCIGRLEPGCLCARAPDPAQQPVAARRLDQRLWRYRPGETARAPPRASGPRPSAGSCATASGRSRRLRFRGRGRRARAADLPAAGSTTVNSTRRTAELGTAAGQRRRIKRPSTEPSRPLSRHPRCAHLEHIGPFRRRAPARSRSALIGSRRLVATTSRSRGSYAPNSLTAANRAENGRRPNCHLGRLGPEDVEADRHGNFAPRGDDPIRSRVPQVDSQ